MLARCSVIGVAVLLAVAPPVSTIAQENNNQSTSLADDLELFLEKHRDDLPPKLHAELASILARHSRPRALAERRATAATGQILSPKAGSPVSGRISVVATAKNIPKGHHVWIAVSRDGLVWPKEPEVKANGQRWAGVAYEGGAPGKLALVMLMVDTEGHNYIQQWFKRGLQTGRYPGILPGQLGSVQLDKVSDLRFDIP